METQRFEKLMEYFKNEDSNIDFMVCMYVQAHKTHTHTRPNGLLIALPSLKNLTLLCKPETAPLPAKPPVNSFLFNRDKREPRFRACARAARPDVRKFKNAKRAFTQLHMFCSTYPNGTP